MVRISYERIKKDTKPQSPSKNARTAARRKIRTVFIAVSIIALSTLYMGLAQAAPRMTCKQIEMLVAQYGQPTLEWYAKYKLGWTDQRIAHARRCIK